MIDWNPNITHNIFKFHTLEKPLYLLGTLVN
jgi:hypothetical protein